MTLRSFVGSVSVARTVVLVFIVAFTLGIGPLACGGRLVSPSDPRVAVMGRVDRTVPGRVRFGYPGVTFRVAFEGPSLDARFTATTAHTRIAVILDGGAPRVIRLARGESQVALASGLGPRPHVIEIVHRTEAWQGMAAVTGFFPGPGGRLLTPPPPHPRRILLIGDSVTCGEAIDRGPPPVCTRDAPASSNAYLSYGMLVGRAVGAEVHLVCYGGRGLIRDWRGNGGVANVSQLFELAVPDPPWRSPWDHAAFIPDAVIVSVGTNDFNLDLGPLPAREPYVSAYVRFVGAIRARAPQAQIFLTEGAIVSDDTDPLRPQKTVLREYIAETARRLGDGRVHPFASTHYPGDACNAHPTGAQHAQMARELEALLRAELRW